jgi:methylenetetrahydrofolate--tRNA-(uracil-5-)-methyltransferase
VTFLPERRRFIATGPLTSEAFADGLIPSLIGEKNLSFFDASAPIIAKSSIDFSKAYFKSRLSRAIAPTSIALSAARNMTTFVMELVGAKKALVHEFRHPLFRRLSCRLK